MKQLTYEELYFLIQTMTPEQRKLPVKMYIPSDGELHPDDKSSHPECGFSSKLVIAQEIELLIPEINQNQYVIYEYMDIESERKCMILHSKEMLSRDDLTLEQRKFQEKRLKQLGELSKDLTMEQREFQEKRLKQLGEL